MVCCCVLLLPFCVPLDVVCGRGCGWLVAAAGQGTPASNPPNHPPPYKPRRLITSTPDYSIIYEPSCASPLGSASFTFPGPASQQAPCSSSLPPLNQLNKLCSFIICVCFGVRTNNQLPCLQRCFPSGANQKTVGCPDNTALSSTFSSAAEEQENNRRDFWGREKIHPSDQRM